MSKKHKDAIQKRFSEAAEAFSKYAEDTPEVLAERVEFSRPQSSDLVLDVACGPGTFALDLARRVRWVHGVDLAEGMLRRARQSQQERGVPNAAFGRGEAETLPYPNATFDLVTCQFSFHHLVKPETVLAEMVRVTKPQGRVMIIDLLGPESDAKMELYNRIEITRDPSHVRSLRWTTFRSMFESHGLRIVDEKVRRRPRRFDLWMRRAGVEPGEKGYNATRRLLEESIPDDRAGFSAELEGDDIRMIHNEGLFLVVRTAF